VCRVVASPLLFRGGVGGGVDTVFKNAAIYPSSRTFCAAGRKNRYFYVVFPAETRDLQNGVFPRLPAGFGRLTFATIFLSNTLAACITPIYRL